MRRQLTLTVFVGFWALCQSQAAWSQWLGTRALSMGSAYRAVATGNDALFFNPAGMPFFRRFNIDADYLYRTASQLPHWTGISIVDSMTTDWTVGLDFHMGINDRENPDQLSYLGTFALAYPISDVFAIGASLKYAYLPAEKSVSQLTGDVGLLVKLPFGLSLAAVGHNLVPTKAAELPLSVGFGAAFSFGGTNERSGQPTDVNKGLALAFDWVLRDLTSQTGMGHRLSGGAEYYLFDVVPVRAGYAWEKDQESRFSCGLGLFLKVIEIDAVFQQSLLLFSERSLGGAVRIFFP